MSLNRDQIAMRVAQELEDGYYVNLGIGIPTLVANYVPSDIEVMLQSENGLPQPGPNWLISGDRGPRERGIGPVNSDREAQS